MSSARLTRWRHGGLRCFRRFEAVTESGKIWNVLKKADVINGATAMLRQFPLLERRVTADAIASCVESAWDQPPHPLVFLLWIAGSDSVGKDGALQLLRTVEIFLALQEKGAHVI